MTVLLNEWAIRLCRSAAIAIAVCFGFLLGWYYCERNVIFDEFKHGIWANEKAIQTNSIRSTKRSINEKAESYALSARDSF